MGKEDEEFDKEKTEILYSKIVITKEDFGRRIYQLTDDRGISAREMSRRCGLNHNYIRSIEQGLSYPSMEKFFVICAVLRIFPDSFFKLIYDSRNVDLRNAHSGTASDMKSGPANKELEEDPDFQQAVQNIQRLPRGMYRIVSEFAVALLDMLPEYERASEPSVLFPDFRRFFKE